MDGRETMRRDWNYPRFWNHPPEFFCQMHGENHTHDTSHCIVLRKEFAMLYPDFMEYRRRRREAAAPIGGRGSGRRMDGPYRQQPRLDSGASWSTGRRPPPPQRAGSEPGGHNGRHSGGRGLEDYRLYHSLQVTIKTNLLAELKHRTKSLTHQTGNYPVTCFVSRPSGITLVKFHSLKVTIKTNLLAELKHQAPN